MGNFNKTVGAASLLLAGSALLSRVVGYLREMVLAWQLGASGSADAYYAAFLLPDMLYYFLSGGAFTVAFLPLYAKHLARGDEARAHTLFSHLFWGGTALLVPTLIAAWALTPYFVATTYPSMAPEAQALTVRLTRIVLPGPLFFFLGGLFAASEAASKRFLATALPPVLYNVGIIAGGFILAPWMGAEGFAWGVLAGAVFGSFMTPALMARRAVKLKRPQSELGADLRSYLKLALPVMLGVSLVTADEWLGRVFGATLQEGAISWLQYSRRLLAVPAALLGMSIGQAMLPWMVEKLEKGELKEARALLRTLLASVTSLSLVSAVALAVFAEPIISIIYERGAFSASDTAQAAMALRWMSAGVLGWSIQTVAVRSYYARQVTWRPALIGTLAVVVSLPGYYLLTSHYGLAGLAAAGGAGLVLTAALTLLDLHFGLKDEVLGATAAACGRGLIAAGISALVGVYLLSWMSAQPALLRFIVAGGAYGVVSLGTLAMVRDPALAVLAGRLRSKMKRRAR